VAKPLYQRTPETVLRGATRDIESLKRRAHGPWHNAGDPGEPVCLLSPDPTYINGVGFRFRRRLGGGCEIQIAVLDGIAGDTVGTLTAGYFLPGEGKIPLTGHNATVAVAFYVDTSTGNIVVGI
jgi:hypothetical protein